MNSAVKNLIRLEFLKLQSTGKAFWIWVIMWAAFSVTGRTAGLGFILFLYAVVISAMSYDELSKSGGLTGTLPVSRRQIVQAKYLYSVLTLVGCAVATSLLGMVGQVLLPKVETNPRALLTVLILMGALFLSVILPLAMCLGPTKARWWMMGAYMVGFGASGAVTGLFNVEDKAASLKMPTMFFMVISVVFLLVSYLLTQKFYARRQFAE